MWTYLYCNRWDKSFPTPWVRPEILHLLLTNEVSPLLCLGLHLPPCVSVCSALQSAILELPNWIFEMLEKGAGAARCIPSTPKTIRQSLNSKFQFKSFKIAACSANFGEMPKLCLANEKKLGKTFLVNSPKLFISYLSSRCWWHATNWLNWHWLRYSSISHFWFGFYAKCPKSANNENSQKWILAEIPRRMCEIGFSF